MFLKKKVSLVALAIAVVFPSLSNANTPTSIIECGQSCNDIHSIVSQVIDLEDYEHDDNMLFKFTDTGVEVNSITYQQFLLDSADITNLLINNNGGVAAIQDAALSCENDRDYDCEAWDDYSGVLKPYILAIENKVYNYEWQHTLTQSEIDSDNTLSQIKYHFAVGALTFAPVAAITVQMLRAVSALTKSEIIQGMLVGGTISVANSFIFTGPNKTKLKAGDIITIKNGRVTKIIRNGQVYSVSSLFGGSGGSDGSSGSGSGGSSSGGTDLGEIPYKPMKCYTAIHGGFPIQVPCV
ncbi:hypothetical protein [Thalassomonas haliotis]|uniref:Uncharacterized protein n=1 Tax=Thalassomonas haliotis TaxID=485448 RepID=A0ABY7VDZ6_9GAMM|nr:hypothetical protein [Thalassomonas haliotis]WDE11571.1 hypothetical protein H3N35_25770 [Thalassomonas haliotis]